MKQRCWLLRVGVWILEPVRIALALGFQLRALYKKPNTLCLVDKGCLAALSLGNRFESDQELRTLFSWATMFVEDRMFLLQAQGCRIKKGDKSFKGILHWKKKFFLRLSEPQEKKLEGWTCLVWLSTQLPPTFLRSSWPRGSLLHEVAAQTAFLQLLLLL